MPIVRYLIQFLHQNLAFFMKSDFFVYLFFLPVFLWIHQISKIQIYPNYLSPLFIKALKYISLIFYFLEGGDNNMMNQTIRATNNLIVWFNILIQQNLNFVILMLYLIFIRMLKRFKLLKLIKPTPSLKEDFLSMILDYRSKSEFFAYHDLGMMDFDLYLKEVEQAELGQNLKPGYVSQNTFWLVLDHKTIVGESRLRHSLTAMLEIEGGNIGYAIRPSHRLNGYGTQILKFTLIEAARLGLAKVLVTCDADNIGSQKIILANGGVFDGETVSPNSRKWVQRYWVPVR